MSHLTLVPSPPRAQAPAPTSPRARRESSERRSAAFEDPNVVALSFFQAASGICLCRACSMRRHPAYAGQ